MSHNAAYDAKRRAERRALGLCQACGYLSRPGKSECASCAEKRKRRVARDVHAHGQKIPEPPRYDGDTGLSRERLGAAACGMLAEPECPRCGLHGEHECISVESYLYTDSQLARAADR